MHGGSTRIIKSPEKKTIPRGNAPHEQETSCRSIHIMSGKIKIRMAFNTMRTMGKMEK